MRKQDCKQCEQMAADSAAIHCASCGRHLSTKHRQMQTSRGIECWSHVSAGVVIEAVEVRQLAETQP